MNSLDLNFTLILPELIVTAASVLVMLADAFDKRGERMRLMAGLSLIGLVAAAAATIWLWVNGISGQQAFNGMVIQDEMRMAFTLIFLLVSALTILISMVWVDQEHLPGGEFYSLLLFATSGMMLMAVGSDLVIIFLGLEILSIATYVMAGFRRSDRRSNESSLKYFILGSFSSAFLLYGIALIYGGTATRSGLVGTTNVYEIALRLNDSLYPGLLFAGAAMLFVGFAFKIATAPFHIWTPDVYEGAPTPVTAFMAAGPKAAGFASFLRVFLVAFPVALSASVAGQLHEAWVSGLAILAVLTMTIGNLVAIVQSNVKRMLAYSSIAHAGYALVGFVAAGTTTDPGLRSEAQAGVIFYLLTYAVMNLGAFTVVTLISRSNDRRTEVEDYTGIGFSVPFLAFSLALFLLSLLGMPLTAGFIGKVAVFGPAIKTNSPTLIAIVVIGVINTAISAYYYLRLIIVMFFRERTTSWTGPRVPASAVAALVITALGVLYLGIFPGTVLDVLRGRHSSNSNTVRPVITTVVNPQEVTGDK
ncbi:MAG: NADH-quinone oxidoreductase subunit N [Pyrinomonadaceae bacterium]